MNAVIVANGEVQDDARLRDIWERADLRIAADGGARNARLALGRPPEIVVGDMDSLDDATRSWLGASASEWRQHPRAKDETDLELAVGIAQARGADKITILGAFGGRVDHFLANVMLLTAAPNVRLVDSQSELWLGSKNEVIEGKAGDIVSLIPLDNAVEGITTTDLEYPLRNETITRGSTRGISNVMLGARATVSWKSGLLLIVRIEI